MQFEHQLMLLLIASLPLVSYTNSSPSSDTIHPLDTENSTHGQLTPPMGAFTACALPYCYDIINKTAHNYGPPIGDKVKQSIGSPSTRNSYESERIATHQPYANNIDDQHWASSSVMYGLLTLDTRHYVNERCHSELRQIYNGILRKEAWAIKG